MKYLPYDIGCFENYNEIKNSSLKFFNLSRRRNTWNFIASELIRIKFTKKLAEKFFTTISLQLYNNFPAIICALIDYEEYNERNYKLRFSNSNQIIKKIIYDDCNEELYFEIFKKKFNYQKVSKIKIFLRNMYFFGNFNHNKIDLIDHNSNSRKFTKKNFNVRYRPSSNFFDFKKIIQKKNSYSEEFKEIFDQNFEHLNIIFCEYLNKNCINKKINYNFSFFLKCFLKFEISIFLETQKILSNSNIGKISSTSISGFKPSRFIASYNYFKGNKVIKFDDQNGGMIHGNHKGAYLNNLINCTDYYLTTTSAKNNTERFYKDFFKKNNIDKQINFHSLNYENKINDIKKDITSKKTKYVYFSISLRNQSFHGSGTFHDIDYLNLQNIVFNFLKSNTNDLLYRPHPESIIGIKKNPIEKYINNLSFEETIRNGNICIFDSTISSAFWQCIQNQNPIILIRHYNVDEKSVYLKRLEERCEIIDIENPDQTENILKNLNFQKISKNSIEKSKTCFDNFDNIIN
jgi:hypothetical protein